jgi:hypothetical protein
MFWGVYIYSAHWMEPDENYVGEIVDDPTPVRICDRRGLRMG